MQYDFAGARRIVIKIGSATLVDRRTGLRRGWLASLAEDIIALRAGGTQVVIVSSGAVALGSPLSHAALPTWLNSLSSNSTRSFGTKNLTCCREPSGRSASTTSHAAIDGSWTATSARTTTLSHDFVELTRWSSSTCRFGFVPGEPGGEDGSVATFGRGRSGGDAAAALTYSPQ